MNWVMIPRLKSWRSTTLLFYFVVTFALFLVFATFMIVNNIVKFNDMPISVTVEGYAGHSAFSLTFVTSVSFLQRLFETCFFFFFAAAAVVIGVVVYNPCTFCYCS